MDIITQAILGAAIGELALGRQLGNKGMLLGAGAGIIPDLDVVLLPFYGDLERLSVHRGFSHSILFSIFGALLLSWLFNRWSRWKEIRFPRWYLLFFIALFTHILLDSFTSYGTQLFLPFSDVRVGFDSISIIDPVYTLPLLIGLIWCFHYNQFESKRRWSNYLGLGLSSLYLVFTLFNKSSVERVFEKSLEEQNIEYVNMLSVPVSFGNLLWYGVAKGSDSLYMGDYSIRDENKKVHFEAFPINDYLLEGLDQKLVDRMKWFSKDFYTVINYDQKIRLYNLQCDMQGIQNVDYKAPTAFYFEIEPLQDGEYRLNSGMHQVKTSLRKKWRRMRGVL